MRIYYNNILYYGVSDSKQKYASKIVTNRVTNEIDPR